LNSEKVKNEPEKTGRTIALAFLRNSAFLFSGAIIYCLLTATLLSVTVVGFIVLVVLRLFRRGYN